MYIKRTLNKRLTLYSGLRFPYHTKTKTSLRHSVTVGIGGNIGDLKRRFEHLYVFLKKEKLVKLEQTSIILKNPPFGYLDQDDFFNAVIVLKTNLNPVECLNYLLKLEKKFRRKRSFRDAPRTLDLDIIFYDNRVVNTKKLQIPHPSWSQRESVLIPLESICR
jgi:2-amino-4-hydroxy-6-hydroxymethyldihydropteridine diphosphokinase